MFFLGIDPGRDKCGVALLGSDGEIKFEEVVPTDELEATIIRLSENFCIDLVPDASLPDSQACHASS